MSGAEYGYDISWVREELRQNLSAIRGTQRKLLRRAGRISSSMPATRELLLEDVRRLEEDARSIEARLGTVEQAGA